MSFPFTEVRKEALSLGWDDVGVTQASIVQEQQDAYENWLKRDYHGKLHYMENRVRKDPTALFPGAKSAIICVSYYRQETLHPKENPGLIASYARGRDYHHVHRKRLKKLIGWLEKRTGTRGIAKGFSDSSPVLEKALAVQANLGWFGKNTLFIHRRFGTFVLLSGLMTSLQISDEQHVLPLPRCGSCTRCLDACPTQAFVEPYVLDATRCLSYHLIESKEDIPLEIQQKNPGYVFGCDVCQDACPHNWRKPLASCSDFKPEQGIGTVLDETTWKQVVGEPESLFGTPLQRRKVEGLGYNLNLLREKPIIQVKKE